MMWGRQDVNASTFNLKNLQAGTVEQADRTRSIQRWHEMIEAVKAGGGGKGWGSQRNVANQGCVQQGAAWLRKYRRKRNKVEEATTRQNGHRSRAGDYARWAKIGLWLPCHSRANKLNAEARARMCSVGAANSGEVTTQRGDGNGKQSCAENCPPPATAPAFAAAGRRG